LNHEQSDAHPGLHVRLQVLLRLWVIDFKRTDARASHEEERDEVDFFVLLLVVEAEDAQDTLITGQIHGDRFGATLFQGRGASAEHSAI